jgi:hypothetical protein
MVKGNNYSSNKNKSWGFNKGHDIPTASKFDPDRFFFPDRYNTKGQRVLPPTYTIHDIFEELTQIYRATVNTLITLAHPILVILIFVNIVIYTVIGAYSIKYNLNLIWTRITIYYFTIMFFMCYMGFIERSNLTSLKIKLYILGFFFSIVALILIYTWCFIIDVINDSPKQYVDMHIGPFNLLKVIEEEVHLEKKIKYIDIFLKEHELYITEEQYAYIMKKDYSYEKAIDVFKLTHRENLEDLESERRNHEYYVNLIYNIGYRIPFKIILPGIVIIFVNTVLWQTTNILAIDIIDFLAEEIENQLNVAILENSVSTTLNFFFF